jgi:putative Mg2+ transporter-C (MgtC) family protein
MTNPWLQWWTDNHPLWDQPTFPRLLLAVILGCIIGAERQWRQRPAGLRTNTLVCLGAAAFVDLAVTLEPEHPTAVISYVVSGVGFLGAGAIMKEGVSIRGLNTAATLWCSAAVGASVGAGEMLDGVFVTTLLLAVNLILRPLSRFIDQRSLASMDRGTLYRIQLTSQGADQSELGHRVDELLKRRSITVRNKALSPASESGEATLEVTVNLPANSTRELTKLVGELKNNPKVIAAQWSQANVDLD